MIENMIVNTWVQDDVYQTFHVLANSLLQTHNFIINIRTPMAQALITQAISQTELKQLKDDMSKAYGISLTDDVSRVSVASMYQVSDLRIITFAIPIEQQADDVTIYRLTPIPIKLNNTAYILTTNVKYLAIAHGKDEYTVLTETEAHKCIHTQHCIAAEPFYTKDVARCGASTYFEGVVSMCPLTPLDKPAPWIYNARNITFVKTFQNTTVKVACNFATPNRAQSISSFKWHGLGTITITPMCQLQLSDIIVKPNQQLQLDYVPPPYKPLFTKESLEVKQKKTSNIDARIALEALAKTAQVTNATSLTTLVVVIAVNVVFFSLTALAAYVYIRTGTEANALARLMIQPSIIQKTPPLDHSTFDRRSGIIKESFKLRKASSQTSDVPGEHLHSDTDRGVSYSPC